jgi:BirA family biotin operon repressor/biotin-[acetyl-CoA-carboxylase] ligase
MTLKNKIISIFEKNKQKTVSGQELADKLSVSRTAVWKAVNALKKEGYPIKASTNNGYILAANSDILSTEGIRLYLSSENKRFDIYVYKTIDSTNNQAKKMVAEGTAKHGTIITADEQTAGRGRFDRKFFSPAKTGVYMTVVFKPNKNAADTQLITIAAAVSVVRAVKKLTGIDTDIKWVNDVFLNGKKICGILTEATIDFESQTAESIIVGIGVNIKTEDFPKEMKKTATSLYCDNLNRNVLIAKIVNNLTVLYSDLKNKNLMQEYKRHSVILNKNISYVINGLKKEGFVTDINEKGNLIVKTSNGKVETLESGEVTIGSGNL